MPTTYEPISTTTLASGTATVTLSAIPQTYTDLVLVVQGTSTVVEPILMQFNGDTGSNFSWTQLGADSGGTFSSRGSSQTSIRIGFSNTAQGNQIVQIMNYSNATTYKTNLSRSNIADVGVRAIAGLWRNTNAITSITVIQNAGSFSAGCTFTLYGIKAA
jgi:hypothetical protein